MEVRTQLQSHGLGGVRNRHHDKHDHMDEKLNALLTLERLWVDDAHNVVPIRRVA